MILNTVITNDHYTFKHLLQETFHRPYSTIFLSLESCYRFCIRPTESSHSQWTVKIRLLINSVDLQMLCNVWEQLTYHYICNKWMSVITRCYNLDGFSPWGPRFNPRENNVGLDRQNGRFVSQYFSLPMLIIIPPPHPTWLQSEHLLIFLLYFQMDPLVGQLYLLKLSILCLNDWCLLFISSHTHILIWK
jgi:hypothetical protein